MALERQIRSAVEQFALALQREADERARALADEIAKAAEEDRMAAEAEAMSTLAAEIAAVRAEADQRVSGETARARQEAEQALAGEIDRLRQEHEQQQEELAALRADADAQRREAEQARDQAETASAEVAVVRDRATAAEQALEEAQASRVSAQVQERQGQMAEFERLVGAVRRIGQAGTLTDVLTALAEAAAAETSRTAILVASGEDFQPFRVHGFSESPRPITRAEAATLTRGLPFAPLPQDHVGFSVPVDMGGQTVAMVYADDCSGEVPTVPAIWPESIEILARHAALRLETLTALRTVQALGGRTPSPSSPVSTAGVSTTEDDQSARRYARLLVSEIKLYNEGAVRLGRQNRDLAERLRPEIERARRLYEERVPAHVPARGAYFDDELVQTLADGDPAVLGSRS